MTVSCHLLAACLLLGSLATAQTLQVFSEFSRIGPDGQVVAGDRGGTPREILSPALPRNGFSSFQIVIRLPAGTPYRLFLGQNPESLISVSLYRPRFERGIPTALEPVRLPVDEKMAATGVAVFWMDLFVSRTTPPQRAKLEPQLGLADRWVPYPMEIRIVDATAPNYQPAKLSLPAEAPADTAALRNLHAYLCGVSLPAGVAVQAPATVAQLLERNATQDRSLAPAGPPPDILWMRTAAPDRQKWCKKPERPAGAGAEWYLRVRDYLLQGK
jgi:hypothetical protein